MTELPAGQRARLKAYRSRHPKMTRMDLAQLIGVNRHWLEKFEQGVINNPTADNLLKVQSWLALIEGLPAVSESGAV